MISGHGDVRTAMEAIRAGANDFLEKPLATEHVLNALRRVLDASRLTRENLELRSRLGLTRLVGEAPVMKKLLSDVARAAPTPATILIVGPSGTGKELVARSIHEGSAVRSGPFIQVNCAAIPETLIESELFGHEKGSFTGAERKQVGKFVEADGGSIFLDEIGDMSLSAQAKVLRVLQEGEVEPVGSPRVVRVKVRVIAATNRDLTEMIRQGKFREDLFYRLNVIPLKTPALAEHPEDVPALVLHFAEAFRADEQLPAEALHRRRAHGPRRTPLAGERPRAEEPRRAADDHDRRRRRRLGRRRGPRRGEARRAGRRPGRSRRSRR